MKSYKNAKCFFNRYVTKIDGNKVYFKYKTLKEDVEETFIETEAVVVAVGFRPNTGLFRSFMSDSLSPNGFVTVNEYFQVKLNQNNCTTRQLIETTKSFIKETREKMIKDLVVNDESEIPDQEEDPEDTNSNEEDILNELIKDKETDEELLSSSSFIIKAPTTPTPKKRLNTVLSFSKDNEDAYSNIFAIGDIIDSNEEKLAFYCEIHGKKVSNVIQQLDGCNDSDELKKKVKPYVTKPDFVSNVVIGNSGLVFKGEKILQKGKFVPIGKAAFEKYLMTQVIPS